MDKNVTVSVRGLLVTGLVLLALAVAYLLGNSGTSAASAAPAAPDGDEQPARTVTMRGVGEVSVVPDQVGFELSVRLTRDDLETALADADDTLARVLAELEELGIPKGDTETTGLDMSPVYHYERDLPPELRGYRVSQTVAVLVRDKSAAGKAITAAIETGGNAVRVYDIQLKVGDPGSAIGEARTDAVAAASEKAEQYAAATGQELGEVVTIVEVDPERTYSQVSRNAYDSDMPMLASAELADGLTIRTGRSQLAVTVQVVWDLA